MLTDTANAQEPGQAPQQLAFHEPMKVSLTMQKPHYRHFGEAQNSEAVVSFRPPSRCVMNQARRIRKPLSSDKWRLPGWKKSQKV
ncbi:MAG: hypothetical protein EBV89_01510 [Betaproteobacteria bacterium]|nr:hypothetical protein [Betaproteobacteria bacterium]